MNTSPTRLIKLPEVEQRTGRSRWWIREKVNSGEFPRPVNIEGRRVLFVEHEVESWLRDKIAERDRKMEVA